MLGIPVRYVLKNPRVALDLLAHPIDLFTKVQDVYIAEREQERPQYPYESDDDWEQQLHQHLAVSWPCQFASEFMELWPEIIKELETKGIKPGPESFGSWNDGDAGLVRAIWCVIRHLKPGKIVETGVAHGVTSRFVLEALERNGGGDLWSIDLPPIEKFWQEQVGAAVGDRYARKWSYIKGSSRRHLPGLLARLGQIDLFIHDSLHSERNVRFELDRAWAALKPGGAMVVDDIDANWGFRSFTQAFSGHQSLVCDAEPLHPDPRRFNQKGLFGIILKEPSAATLAA
jgi:Methyltransferase domain